MKKLPPYGKALHELQLQGLRPQNSINIFVGQGAWQKGQNFSISYPERTLVLPAYQCPSLFEWPVNECDVLIVDTGYCEKDYLNDIAFYLYQNKAEIVRCIPPELTLVIFNN